MENLVTEITTSLTPATFYDAVAELVPFLVILVPVGLSIHFLRRMIKGAAKAKVKF